MLFFKRLLISLVVTSCILTTVQAADKIGNRKKRRAAQFANKQPQPTAAPTKSAPSTSPATSATAQANTKPVAKKSRNTVVVTSHTAIARPARATVPPLSSVRSKQQSTPNDKILLENLMMMEAPDPKKTSLEQIHLALAEYVLNIKKKTDKATSTTILQTKLMLIFFTGFNDSKRRQLLQSYLEDKKNCTNKNLKMDMHERAGLLEAINICLCEIRNIELATKKPQPTRASAPTAAAALIHLPAPTAAASAKASAVQTLAPAPAPTTAPALASRSENTPQTTAPTTPNLDSAATATAPAAQPQVTVAPAPAPTSTTATPAPQPAPSATTAQPAQPNPATTSAATTSATPAVIVTITPPAPTPILSSGTTTVPAAATSTATTRVPVASPSVNPLPAPTAAATPTPPARATTTLPQSPSLPPAAVSIEPLPNTKPTHKKPAKAQKLHKKSILDTKSTALGLAASLACMSITCASGALSFSTSCLGAIIGSTIYPVYKAVSDTKHYKNNKVTTWFFAASLALGTLAWLN